MEYRPERQHALLDDVIRWTEEHYTEALAQGAVRSADEFAAGWLETLTAIGACLKHPKFDDEREWRIIYYARDEDLARMQFVQRRATISRHIPLSYREAPGT